MKKQAEKVPTNKMGTEPVLKLIITMSLPAMFSMLVQGMYNIVDSMFVARVGNDAFTAISLALPIQMLMIAFSVGTGIGLNSLISRRLGAGKQEDADNAATHGIFLGLVTGLTFAIIGLIAIKPFFGMFTSDEAIYTMGCQYGFVVTFFSMGSFLEVYTEKIIQSTGNMLYPMVMQLIGAITNLILDPIMIFGLFGFPKLGVRGAAIATVTGQIIAMIFGLYILFNRNHGVNIHFKNFRPKLDIIKEIYKVGFPSIVMQSISSFLITALNGILINFSASAVNVLGIYYKVQSFIFMPLFGLCQGLMPIMGYNFGARNKKRLLDALKYGLTIAIAIMSLGTAVFMIFPSQLLAIFNANEEVLALGIPALRIVSLCFIGASVGIILSNTYQSVGNGLYSLIVSILRQAVIILPFAFIMSKFWGVTAVWMSFPVSEYIATSVSIVLMVRVYRTKIKDLDVDLDALNQ